MKISCILKSSEMSAVHLRGLRLRALQLRAF
jgi:hypothetical protein